MFLSNKARPSWVFYPIPWEILKFFFFGGGGGTGSIPGPECLTLFSNIFRSFYPAFGSCLTYIHWLVLSWSMHISRVLFLFSSLFLSPLPVNSNCLDLCGSPLLSSFQSIHQATSEFLPPVFQPVNSLKAVGWDSHKVPRLLLYFSWVTIHYCLRFSISKTIVF